MNENNFISGYGKASVARRDRTPRHELCDERQRRRDEDGEALDGCCSRPATTRGVGETNSRCRARGLSEATRQSRGTASAPRLRQQAGLARAGAGPAA